MEKYFFTDNQTIKDLCLFGQNKKEHSVFSLFNYTKTTGGKKQLEYLFKNPLTDIELIKKRVETIKFFQDFSFGFIIDKDYFDFIEIYLKLQHIPVKLSAFDSFIKGIKYRIFPKNHYFIIQRGTLFLIKILNGIYKSFKEVDPASACVWVQNSRKEVLDMIDNSPLRIILKMKNRRRLSAIETRRLDYYFRKSYYNEIRKILETIYLFDALFSIAEAKKQLGFSLPELISEPDRFQAEMLFHPLLQEPVANDIIFDDLKHICFLTGPNMAGKSTFLKAIGISLYLAHAGFPVPASHLTTSVFNGLLTTINLPDNLVNGYSHFYNEVLRVKYVARQANEREKIFVVFDEIFRGTNVKDAYEASLAVITAFARRKDSLLAVSTHILEVAEALKDDPNIFFKYFETGLENELPVYSYRLKDGITGERIGMYILKKEELIETIENSKQNSLNNP